MNERIKQLFGIFIGLIFVLVMMLMGLRQMFLVSDPDWVNPVIGVGMLAVAFFVGWVISNSIRNSSSM